MTGARKNRPQTSTIPKAPEPAAAKRTEVKITPAKGRPMLTWVGKRPLSHVTAFPAQHEETFDPVGAGLVLPRAQQAAPLHDATIWSDWPAAYPKCETAVPVMIIDMLVSCLRGSLNKSPGYGSLGKACHPESFDCHSERSEESQDKLREGSQTSRHSSPEPALSSL